MIVFLGASAMMAQEAKYPPPSEYVMDRDAGIALAKSAAPQAISDRATITGAPTFTPVQIRTVITYDGKTRAPICLNPQAVRIVLPYYELRTKLGMEGKTADQVLGPVGHWHPQMMMCLPNYENSMLGGNPPGSHLPTVGDDAGAPFAVGFIPVDDKLAIKARDSAQ